MRRYTQEDLRRLLEEITRSLVDDLSSNAVLCSIRILNADRTSLVSVSRFSSDLSPVMLELEPAIPVGGPDGGIIGGGRYGDDGKPVHTVGGDAVLKQTIQEVTDLSKDERFSNENIIRAGYTSMMAVPIIFDGNPLGVSQIYSKTTGYRFSKSEKKMATTICDNLAHFLVIKDQAEKIEALEERDRRNSMYAMMGQVAATIIHDLKTCLTSLGGFAYRIAKKPKDENVERWAGIVAGEVARLEGLVSEVLVFARKEPTKERTDIIGLLNDIIGSTYAGDVTIERRFHQNNQIMNIDPGQIGGTLRELLKNAIDASKENGGKSIAVRTYPYDKKERHSLCVEIENKGHISEDILPHIFEFSFTTKTHGTGIGLAGSLATAELHNGTLRCKNLGDKVVFRLYLPRP